MTLCGTCPHLGGRLQAWNSASSRVFSGSRLQFLSRHSSRCTASVARPLTQAAAETAERFRLNNLSPQKGARRQEKRKGRGYGSGQGGTCGFGMRGQKARSGSGVRHGFEGGQTPLYRQLPKLKGIAGGMSAGLPKYIVVNLKTLSDKFSEGEEVSLDTMSQKRMLNLSGREAKLPLKVLGDGDLTLKLTIKAAKFSGSAKEKIQAAGGEAVEVPQKEKWTRALGRRKAAAAAAATATSKSSTKQKAEKTAA